MNILTFRIPGLPIAKQRHRNSGKRTYDPQTEIEKLMHAVLKRQLPKGHALIRGPVVFAISAYFPRPVSHYGTGKNIDRLKPSAPKYHVITPDYSNLAKFYEDCMNKIVYFDDCQIVGYNRGAKYWLEKDKFGYVEISIKEVT